MYIGGFYLLNITLTSNWVLIDSLQFISGLEEFVRLFFRCFHFFCTFALDSPSLRKRCPMFLPPILLIHTPILCNRDKLGIIYVYHCD